MLELRFTRNVEGTRPLALFTYGSSSQRVFAQGGHWAGVTGGFIMPEQQLGFRIKPGSLFRISDDDGTFRVWLKDIARGAHVRVDSLDEAVSLTDEPGRYQIRVSGVWPQGNADYWVGFTVGPPSVAG